MLSLKRYVRSIVIFLVCLSFLWFFISNVVLVPASTRQHTVCDTFIIQPKLNTGNAERLSNQRRTNQTKKTIKETKDILNSANQALMLEWMNKTLTKLINDIYAKRRRPAAITRKPTARLTKPSAKPSIDMTNDYYPYVDFKFVFPEISPKFDSIPNIFMIVLVNSGARGNKYRKLRETIRQTWGNRNSCQQRKASRDKKLKDLKWLLVFVVGKAGPGTNDDELNTFEAKKHNDMLIGSITDNYVNNIIKFYMGQLWSIRFNAQYILKTDDDVYVRIPWALEYIVNAKFPRPLYAGAANRPGIVSRNSKLKWGLSWKYYSKKYFPMYNHGAFFILSSDLQNRLFNYIYIRKPFHIDDAYIGLAMAYNNVKTTNIQSFRINRKLNYTECEKLGLNGIGDSLGPQTITKLHHCFESHLCKPSTSKVNNGRDTYSANSGNNAKV